MKGRLAVLLLLAGCLLIHGGAELEEVELVLVLGVDGGGEVTLTAATGREETNCYQASGHDLPAAQDHLRYRGTKRLELTHVAQLVLGEDVDVERALLEEVSCRKTGYEAALWLCSGSAGTLLRNAKDPAGRLRSLEENAGAAAPGLMDALRTLRRTGKALVPVAVGEGEELIFAGYREVTACG